MHSQSRVIEMIQAERLRLGLPETSPITADSPPILRMSIIASFLVELGLLELFHPELAKKWARLQETIAYLFLVTDVTPMLETPEFRTILNALKQDYLDNLPKKLHD